MKDQYLRSLQGYGDQAIPGQLKKHDRKHVLAILTSYMETRLYALRSRAAMDSKRSMQSLQTVELSCTLCNCQKPQKKLQRGHVTRCNFPYNSVRCNLVKCVHCVLVHFSIRVAKRACYTLQRVLQHYRNTSCRENSTV